MTDAPRISPEELAFFLDQQARYGAERALAAFLRARVPEPMPDDGDAAFTGFNACRDLVLKGRE